jgi:hypothetical protein
MTEFLAYWRALERASTGLFSKAPTIEEASMTFAAGASRLAALDLIGAARAIQRAVRDETTAECSEPRLVDS